MSDPLEQLARLLSRLPGVGKKSGARMAHFLWRANPRYLIDLGQAILSLQETVRACPECGADMRPMRKSLSARIRFFSASNNSSRR